MYSFDCVYTHSFSCINDDVLKILKTIELDRSEIREVNSSPSVCIYVYIVSESLKKRVRQRSE